MTSEDCTIIGGSKIFNIGKREFKYTEKQSNNSKLICKGFIFKKIY